MRPSTVASARRSDGLVVAWMPVSRRSETLAARLGFDRLIAGRAGFRRPWTAPLAYPFLAARTLAAIARLRPRAIVVVAPPVFAPLVVLVPARVLGARVAIDVHTGALLDRRWRWSTGLLAWAARRADATIVTLASLADRLADRRVEALVIPDPLPELRRPGGGAAPEASPAVPPSVSPEVVAVCGWGDDEPIEALVAAARGHPWRLALTGRPKRSIDLPSNVELTGFLDDETYVGRLASAAAVVVLTTREDTLLSGAWEAIAVGRPLVLSDTAALRDTFGAGPAYVTPEAEAIGAGIDAALADPVRAAAATGALRDRFATANDAALGLLRERLVSRRPDAR